MEFTDRQVWKTLRGLVSSNNAQIRQIYSAAVYARMNVRYESVYPKEILDLKKQEVVGSSMKEISRRIADKYIGDDFVARDRYTQLSYMGKKWQDHLSSDDLFQLFIMQNKILAKMSRLERVDLPSVNQIISQVKFGTYSTPKVDFTGKPAKVEADKIPFNPEDPKVIEEVLIDSAQRLYDRYSQRTGLLPDRISPEDMSKINFGAMSGRIASTYAISYEQETQAIMEEMSKPKSDKMVGVDEQGTPVFERVDRDGNYTYYTHFNDNFSGHVFGEDDAGREIYIGEFGVPETTPTEDTDVEFLMKQNPQTPLIKPDVAILSKTVDPVEQN